ncbi:MAG: hypothetical protein EBU52_11155 [Cytophagia bacterium]|nr:hypothetical protein [Cytophagia bacterium]
MKLLARFISVVTHPLLLATYLFSLFAWLYPPAMFPVPERSFRGVLMLIFICTFLLPVINVYFFKVFGTISSMSMPLRKERIAPFLMIAILYAVITYLLHAKLGLGFQDPLVKFLLIIDALVLAAFIVTLWMKASVHSLATGGLMVMLAMLNSMTENGVLFYPLLGSILLTGLVMTARLYLQVHTFKEVVVGFCLGCLVSVIGMIYLF